MMYSIILAAGQGTRLRPLSYYIPKILMPIRGTPVLSYLLANMKGLKIDTHYIVASNHINAINNYIEKANLKNVKTIQALGWETGGDLAIALEEINKDDDVIVMNGDLITDIKLDELYKDHKKSGADVTMALFPVNDANEIRRLSTVKLDKYNRITEFNEKPRDIKEIPSMVSAGFYVFSKEFIKMKAEYLKPKKFKIEFGLFPRLAKEGKLYGSVQNLKYFWDIGTNESYLLAENYLLNKEGIIR